MVNHCKKGLTLLFSCTVTTYIKWLSQVGVKSVPAGCWVRIVLINIIDTHGEAQLKHAFIIKICGLAAFDSALDDNCRLTELRVIFWLDQLEQYIDFRLVLLQRCSEIVSDDRLLTGLKLRIDMLLDGFVLLVLDEWLEGPCHVRLILHGELDCDLTALDPLYIHEVFGHQHGHLR